MPGRGRMNVEHVDLLAALSSEANPTGEPSIVPSKVSCAREPRGECLLVVRRGDPGLALGIAVVLARSSSSTLARKISGSSGASAGRNGRIARSAVARRAIIARPPGWCRPSRILAAPRRCAASSSRMRSDCFREVPGVRGRHSGAAILIRLHTLSRSSGSAGSPTHSCRDRVRRDPQTAAVKGSACRPAPVAPCSHSRPSVSPIWRAAC